jgi:hypothetical protein
MFGLSYSYLALRAWPHKLAAIGRSAQPKVAGSTASAAVGLAHQFWFFRQAFLTNTNIYEHCSGLFGERTRTHPLRGVRVFATRVQQVVASVNGENSLSANVLSNDITHSF